MEKESLIPKFTSRDIFYIFGALAIGIFALIYFSGIIKPFVIALLVWFIIDQLKLVIQKITIHGRSLPSWISNMLAIIIIFLVIYVVVKLLIINIEGIIASMPEYTSNLKESFGDISSFFNNSRFGEELQNWVNKLDLAGWATKFVNSLSGILAGLAIVIVYVIFFMLEGNSHKLKVEKLFPGKGKSYEIFFTNLENISASIRSYIWSMTLISLMTGGTSYIVLLIMGVDYAFLWAFLIFVMNYIPYVGPLFSSLFPAIFAVLITGNLWQFLYVFAAMEGIQILLGNLVQPKLMGRGSNLSPVTVILALASWGMIWGIVGMMLAVPLMAVTVIVCSQIPSARFIAILLSEKGNIPAMEK